MESHLYVCEYCSTAYKPKKRGTQKYCSAKCRVNAFNLRKKAKKEKAPNIDYQELPNHIQKFENTINAAGIGNAVIGSAIVNGAQHFLTNPENRPATRGDIRELMARYNPVLNMNLKPDGTRPYYDQERQVVVYMRKN